MGKEYILKYELIEMPVGEHSKALLKPSEVGCEVRPSYGIVPDPSIRTLVKGSNNVTNLITNIKDCLYMEDSPENTLDREWLGDYGFQSDKELVDPREEGTVTSSETTLREEYCPRNKRLSMDKFFKKGDILYTEEGFKVKVLEDTIGHYTIVEDESYVSDPTKASIAAYVMDTSKLFSCNPIKAPVLDSIVQLELSEKIRGAINALKDLDEVVKSIHSTN